MKDLRNGNMHNNFTKKGNKLNIVTEDNWRGEPEEHSKWLQYKEDHILQATWFVLTSITMLG